MDDGDLGPVVVLRQAEGVSKFPCAHGRRLSESTDNPGHMQFTTARREAKLIDRSGDGGRRIHFATVLALSPFPSRFFRRPVLFDRRGAYPPSSVHYM